jgi:hypothetical protein
MRERPIIFSGPMVRAVTRLEDPKTQTRRPVTGAALEWCDQFEALAAVLLPQVPERLAYLDEDRPGGARTRPPGAGR